MIAFLLMSKESKKFFSEITLCCAIKHLYFNNYPGIIFAYYKFCFIFFEQLKIVELCVHLISDLYYMTCMYAHTCVLFVC